MIPTVDLRHGDCLDILKTLPDESAHAVITDPPYGLANTDSGHVVETLSRWFAGERDYLPSGAGFMGKAWDAFVPPPAVWDECLRVLKPGGHLLAFAGSRTQDLMGLSIRLAGFDLRDTVTWLYGSGFPKSLDVGKAIDKAGGASPETQARVLRAARERSNLTRETVAGVIGCTAASVRDWEEGRARAVGRAVEFITPSPQYRDKLADLLGYTADERIVTGAVLDRRGDGTVIGLGHSGVTYGGPATSEAQRWNGWGTALKPASEPIVVARKPLAGTVAANVLAHGTGALNIDACRVSMAEGDDGFRARIGGFSDSDIYGTSKGYGMQSAPSGRWPANVVLDEHAAAALDEDSGERQAGRFPGRQNIEPGGDGTTMGAGWNGAVAPERTLDSGGASRFFPVFKYQAKAPVKERPKVDGVAHPTVKPLDLMRWLVRLVTPPGGTVLEPFAGSGTTVEAALLEGFDVVAVEREADYLPLIQQRIDRVTAATEQVEDEPEGLW